MVRDLGDRADRSDPRPSPAPSTSCCARGSGARFRVAELERLLWDERALFENWAHIVPTSDYWMHRDSMRRFPTGGSYVGLARAGTSRSG